MRAGLLPSLVVGVSMLWAGTPQADVYAGFSTSTVTVPVGGTFTASIVIAQADADFNGFDASARFDPAMLTFVPTSPIANQCGALMTDACSNTFHKFTAASDSLKITLVLICSNTTVTGPGTIYQVQFQAGSTPGTTHLTLGPFTEFYRAGIFVRPLHTQDLTVNIVTVTGVDPLPDGGGLMFAPPTPNPRRGEGAVLFEFTLPTADVVSFDVLDLEGRRVAGRAAESLSAGRHWRSWSPPSLASGAYFVRLRTGSSGSVTRRWITLE